MYAVKGNVNADMYGLKTIMEVVWIKKTFFMTKYVFN